MLLFLWRVGSLLKQEIIVFSTFQQEYIFFSVLLTRKHTTQTPTMLHISPTYSVPLHLKTEDLNLKNKLNQYGQAGELHCMETHYYYKSPIEHCIF